MTGAVLHFDRVGLVSAGQRVLDGCSLALQPGERMAVVGASGVGKSVLFRLATGLTAPLSGRVALFGTALEGLESTALRTLRARCGVVLQGPSLISAHTVEENLWLGLPAGVQSRSRMQARITRVTLDFAIEHLGQAQVHALSAGERRRVELARAFLRDPELLLLDEPLAGCVDGAAELEAALHRHIVLRRRALLLLTQDHGLASRLGQTVHQLAGGRLVQQVSATATSPSAA